MSKIKYINVEIDVDDALNMILSEITVDTLLGKLDKDEVMSCLSIRDFTDYFETNDILAQFSDSEIEEFINR